MTCFPHPILVKRYAPGPGSARRAAGARRVAGDDILSGSDFSGFARKFLLNNIYGLPIPPPPPGIDSNLADSKPGTAPKTMRERLTQHRSSPTCNNCHSSIDPLGFALENFDVIGGWRTVDEAGKPVDATGTTPNGKNIQGLSGLRALLLDDPEQFPRTVTEKLMAYALGRRVEYYDLPAIRKIVRDAGPQNYKWSSIIVGIVKSPGFLMRSKV